MKFYEKLIELRKQYGLSQEELGNKINVSRQTISKWESGQANPEIENVKELSKVFNISIEYLLNDESENNIEQKNVESKNNFLQIKKIILIIILTVLAIYVLIVAYKFIILLIYSIKANKISDYDTYMIMIGNTANDKVLNESYEYSEIINYTNNIEVIQVFEEGLEEPTSITYKNSQEKMAYNLQYDSEIGKYVYSDLVDINEDDIETLFTHTTIKKLTQESIPNNIGTIILASLNPKVKVSIDSNYLCIKTQLPNSIGGYNQVKIDINTGILNEVLANTETSLDITHYDYIFEDKLIDNYMIEQRYLEDIEYVMEEIEE